METTLFRKNLREQTEMRKNWKASSTGKTLCRKVTRKALMKTVKKQIAKHIKELNPTNVSLVSLSEAKRVLPHHESDLLGKDSVLHRHRQLLPSFLSIIVLQ